jgi:hypothetical protein
MAFTYAWEVTGLKKRNTTNSAGETLTGAVVQTYWKCTGTDENGESGSFSGATPFSAADVPAGSFVPFEQLTEETVLGWIRNVVDNDPTYWEHIQERISKEVDAKNIEEVSSLPWAPEETAEVTPPVPGAEPADSEVDPTANTAE